MAWLSSAAIIGLFATALAAQTRPDFSGRWTSTPVGDMGSGWGSNITITQDASRLTVEYEFFTPDDMQPPLIFVYALDGTETALPYNDPEAPSSPVGYLR